jgi:hypothetical protein
MNKPLTSKDLLADALGLNDDILKRLLMLAERIDMDPNTGTLKITNGKSSITMRENGEIRVAGTSIVQTSEHDITLDAAWIDLN